MGASFPLFIPGKIRRRRGPRVQVDREISRSQRAQCRQQMLLSALRTRIQPLADPLKATPQVQQRQQDKAAAEHNTGDEQDEVRGRHVTELKLD